ncbi:hypothetical protein SUGI_0425540 [Cryptomeria japonica]|nr:hypothetical protein SUGI_0425220 [Cryptomeria japonica]GLJ22616.1 hypothetical protein SUGI_0425540 [Cryptomeria japonica]
MARVAAFTSSPGYCNPRGGDENMEPRADVIEKLLHHKPEIATEVDNFDRTPLHMAALLPYLHYFLTGKMLIRNDSGYKVDQNKQSALHVAVKEGNAALVDVILYYSRDCLEMVDNDGRIALHLLEVDDIA